MAFQIKINNLDLVLKNIKGITVQVQDRLNKELDSFGLNTVNDAKRLAPDDEGILKGSISYKKDNLRVTITVGVNYAAFLEFGTRKFAAAYVSSLPPDWQTFAATFKGKGGGSFEELVMRITEWVKRKGIGKTFNVATHRRDKIGKQTAAVTDYATAYEIAHYILITGIRPQPFLFPAYEKNRIVLVANLKAALK